MSDFETTDVDTELEDDEAFAPDFDGGGSADDMTLDFSGVEGRSGFEAIPAGWYLANITDYSDTETKNAAKLPAGTPGTNWEFTIDAAAHPEQANRKQWTNHWHHAKTLGFMKGMFACLDNFTAEELEGSLRLSDRQRAVGQPILIKVARRKYNDDWVNDIKAYKNHRDGVGEDAADDLAP